MSMSSTRQNNYTLLTNIINDCTMFQNVLPKLLYAIGYHRKWRVGNRKFQNVLPKFVYAIGYIIVIFQTPVQCYDCENCAVAGNVTCTSNNGICNVSMAMLALSVYQITKS